METRGNLKKLSVGKVHILTRSATGVGGEGAAAQFTVCIQSKEGDRGATTAVEPDE